MTKTVLFNNSLFQDAVVLINNSLFQEAVESEIINTHNEEEGGYFGR